MSLGCPANCRSAHGELSLVVHVVTAVEGVGDAEGDEPADDEGDGAPPVPEGVCCPTPTSAPTFPFRRPLFVPRRFLWSPLSVVTT